MRVEREIKGFRVGALLKGLVVIPEDSDQLRAGADARLGVLGLPKEADRD